MRAMHVESPDVLILGGGVVGLACALYLLESGRSVTVLEQGAPGGGSSHGNCGTLTPSHAVPLAMPGTLGTALKWLFRPDAPLRIRPRLDPALARWLLMFAARCNWRDFAQATRSRAALLNLSRMLIEELVRRHRLDCEFGDGGTLYVYRDAAQLERTDAWMPRALAEVGVPIERLDAAELMAREPALRDGVAGGYHHPADGWLRPDRFVAELARVVRALGGRIEEQARIEAIERDGARVRRVRTTRGDFGGGEVVCALGAWTPALAAPLGLRVPIQPGKGYSITYTRPVLCPRLPLVLRERSVCVTAWSSGYRLGSTMEFSGYDTTLNRVRLDALRRGAAEYLHEPEGGQVCEEWYGWRPMTPDDLPLIGRVPGIDNLVMAGGHGMLGVSMSAATGLLVSEIVGARAPTLDIAPYAPGRYAGLRAG